MLHKMGWIEAKDGTKLFFRLFGDATDKPPLVLSDGIGCAGYVWKYVIEYFSNTHTVLHWNYPGHGDSSSPPDLSSMTIERLADDLDTIMAELELPPAIVMGHSMGVQVIFEFWHRHKERIAGLVPVCGSYEHPLDTFKNSSWLRIMLPYFLEYYPLLKLPAKVLWKRIVPSEFGYWFSLLVEVNPMLIKREDFEGYLRELSALDPELFLNLLKSAQEHSAKEYLPTIDVPTLVIAGEKDGFTPAWLSDKMAELIPNSEKLVIPAGSHTAPIELPELMNLRLEKWINEHFATKRKKKTSTRRTRSTTKKK